MSAGKTSVFPPGTYWQNTLLETIIHHEISYHIWSIETVDEIEAIVQNLIIHQKLEKLQEKGFASHVLLICSKIGGKVIVVKTNNKVVACHIIFPYKDIDAENFLIEYQPIFFSECPPIIKEKLKSYAEKFRIKLDFSPSKQFISPIDAEKLLEIAQFQTLENDQWQKDDLILRLRRFDPASNLNQIILLAQKVWGFPAEHMISKEAFLLAPMTGGFLIEALDPEKKSIGFAYVLVGQNKENELFSHWHAMGIDPTTQHRGTGNAIGQLWIYLLLKERMVKEGYFTYDPLRGANASLFIHRWGGQVAAFVQDMYGTATTDDDENHATAAPDRFIYANAATDRFLVRFDFQKIETINRFFGLEQPTVESHHDIKIVEIPDDIDLLPTDDQKETILTLENKQKILNLTFMEQSLLYVQGKKKAKRFSQETIQFLEIVKQFVENEDVLVDLRKSVSSMLTQGEAKMKFRKEISTAFNEGYEVVDFIRGGLQQKNHYLLTKK